MTKTQIYRKLGFKSTSWEAKEEVVSYKQSGQLWGYLYSNKKQSKG